MNDILAYHIIPVTPFKQNCSIVWCKKTRLAAIVDPGGGIKKIQSALKQYEIDADKILITHGHLDHAAKTGELARKLGLPIYGPHKADQFWINKIPSQCQQYGFEGDSFVPDYWLEDNDSITVGELNFTVIHTPGHTPGHVVFVEKTQQFAMVGDVIFDGSIGRTDFPRGNHQDLIDSIRKKLFPLGGGIRFIPGHGAMSTFAKQRKTNSFVGDKHFS